MSIDPITLEIMSNGFKSIADETYIALMKSAYSTNIKERHDHSTAIIDPKGRLIVQAENSLAIHLGSMMGLMNTLLAKMPLSQVREGDIFISNDPYAAGGSHLPDVNMAMPVFAGGKLVCFMCNIAHHSDFGGMIAGSMAGGMTEIYQEGLRVPPVRLYRGGQLVAEVLALLLLNTRVQEERHGDLLAQIAACRLGAKRLAELLAAYGVDTVLDGFDELIRRTEQRLRSAIAGVPDGVYTFEDVVDDDGAGTTRIPIRLTATVAGDTLHLDFSDSSPQVRGNVNCTASATQSAVAYAIKALLDPEVPNNQGAFDAVQWVAPPGSIVNARYPAAVAHRAQTVQRIIDVILGALAKALPDRAVGAANGANTTAVFSGIRPDTGTQYVYLETLGGGFGARANKDGKDGVQVHITNTSNLPVEVIESEYPLYVESYSLVPDSGGAGMCRGGLGLSRVIRPVGHTCLFSGSGERFVHPPWGIFGGQAGKPGSFFLRRRDGSTARLPNKPAGIEISEGEAVILTTPGAGGYGSPARRAAERNVQDFISGKFSRGYLERAYGIELHAHAEEQV